MKTPGQLSVEINTLNPEQAEAARHRGVPLLISTES